MGSPMANINSDRFDAPASKPYAGVLGVAYAETSITVAQSANDTITWFKLPQGVVVLDGWLRGDDIDTGTEAYQLDIGTADDPDKYLDSGVITGDAVAFIKGVGTQIRIDTGTVLASGSNPIKAATTEEETILGTVVAAANAGGTGTLGLFLYYTSA